jgi:hypothetical protein
MASRDTLGICKWDDDDIYLDDALASQSHALERGRWSQCRQILEIQQDGSYIRQYTFHASNARSFAYHGSWAYRRDLFAKVQGYPFRQDEEYLMALNCTASAGASVDPMTPKFPLPWYVYDRISNRAHFSDAGCNQHAYDLRGQETVIPCPAIVPAWDRDYAAIPIPETIRRRPW